MSLCENHWYISFDGKNVKHDNIKFMFKLKIGDFNFLSFMCAVWLFVAILD